MATWPALCVLFVKHSKEEVAVLQKGTAKRGIDAQLSACLKKLVEKAEDSRRRSGAATNRPRSSADASRPRHATPSHAFHIPHGQCEPDSWDAHVCAGRGGMLLLKISSLCAHITDVMQTATLDSQIGKEYARLLAKHLLSCPKYMAHLQPRCAHGRAAACP